VEQQCCDGLNFGYFYDSIEIPVLQQTVDVQLSFAVATDYARWQRHRRLPTPRTLTSNNDAPTPTLSLAAAATSMADIYSVTPCSDVPLIGLMVYSFARIGAALGMAVEDVFAQNRRLWVRLGEKGGKRHAMPCHHNLEAQSSTRGGRSDAVLGAVRWGAGMRSAVGVAAVG
jgi:integrase